MNNKNQRDEFTPLVVDDGNTTEEEGATTMMTTIITTIRRSPKALLLLGLAATAAVSNTAWNQYQTPPPPLAQLNKSVTGSGKPIVTVVNNCPNTQVLYNGPATGGQQTACTGSKCSEFAAAGGAAFYIGRYGWGTQAELTVFDGGAWVDISRIEGFNHGVSIKDKAGVSPVNLVCNGVNCKDAYWLCDTAHGNLLFSPNTKLYANEIVVTFCPQGEADTDYFRSTNKCDGAVQNTQADTTKGSYRCWGEFKPITTCESGGGGGGGGTCEDFCHGDWGNRNEGRHCAPGNMASRCGGCDYCESACTPKGGDVYYHPGWEGKLGCCAGLHENNEGGAIRCQR